MSADALPLLRWTRQEYADAYELGAFESHGRVQMTPTTSARRTGI